MPKIDWSAIHVEIAKAPKIKKEAFIVAKNILNDYKNELLQDFDNHIITQELEAGPNAENISGILNGYGNLFSFIGFNVGDEPTRYIKRALRQLIKLNQNALYSKYLSGSPQKISVGFLVNIPSLEEINELYTEEAAFPDEYSAGSWAESLEKGKLTGLSSYLYDPEFESYEQSRSTAGLQAKTRKGKLIKIRGGNTARKTPYITDLLNKFAIKIRSSVVG